MSAIDEAVGWEGTPRNIETTLAWLADVGVEEALRRVKSRCESAEPSVQDGTLETVSVSGELLGRARYRLSGRWFDTVRTDWKISDGVHRRSWALECPFDPVPSEPNSRTPLDEIVSQAMALRPRSLLDIASGGGFCISRLMAHLNDVEIAIACDRSLDDCIWVTQYKLEHIGSGDRADAVGADVRSLPFSGETFDVVSCFHGLYEIQGVTRAFDEVHRVLRSGGHFIVAAHSCYPFFGVPLPDGLTMPDFQRFADAADLHHLDLHHFRERGDSAGFRVVSEHHPGDLPDTFAAVLKKM